MASRTALPTTLLIALLALAAGCTGAESRHAEAMQRGEEYFRSENFEKARVEFGNALQVAPDDAQARYMSGRVAEKLGNLRDAIAGYQGAIDSDSSHAGARAALGRIYVFAGAPDKAMETIEPALQAHPDDAELLTVRGAARTVLKDKAGALADAERAVQLAPDSENAVALLASLYRQSEEPARAGKLLEDSLARLPKSVDLRQVLSTIRLGDGDVEGAITQLAEIVKLKPEVVAHRFQLALLYTRLKRLDEAEKTLRDGVAAMPGSREAKLALVDFLVAQRSRETGEKQMRDFVAAAPADLEMKLALGSLLDRGGNVDGAIETYQSVISADGDKAQGLSARNRIAAIRLRQGQRDDAKRLVGEVLQKNPRDNDALIMRGNLALESNDPGAAIADLRAALRDQPDAVGVMRVLARAHLANNEAPLAEENLRRAVQVAPADNGVRLELAQLLAQTGRADQAVALAEEAVKSAPQDVAARETLARFYLGTNQLDRARTAAEDLKLLRPDLASGHYLAGSVAVAQKRSDDARKDFEQALSIQPGAVDALAALTRLDMSANRQAVAMSRVVSLVEQQPKNAAAQNLLGELQLAAKDYAAARQSFSAALTNGPRWWVPYRNLALAELAERRTDEAIAAYRKGIDATSQEPNLVTDLATLYERGGKPDEAIKLYESLLAAKPRLELAANNLAMMLITHRNDQPSLDRARDLTASFAGLNNPALLDTHGWVLYRRGAYAESLPALERAVELAPGSPLLRYHLGMAQLQTGQTENARRNLEISTSGQSNFTGSDEARAALAKLAAKGG
jgi:tetratricopeptide (TPR) repeat protein